MPPSNIRKIIFSLKKYIFLEEQTTQLTDILWLKYFVFSSIRMVDEIGGEKRRGGEKKGQYFLHVSNLFFMFSFILLLKFSWQVFSLQEKYLHTLFLYLICLLITLASRFSLPFDSLSFLGHISWLCSSTCAAKLWVWWNRDYLNILISRVFEGQSCTLWELSSSPVKTERSSTYLGLG